MDTISSPYHEQQQGIITNEGEDDYIEEDNNIPSTIPTSWSFADIHKTRRQLSRDKSQHATDEVFNSMSHMAAAMISLLGMVLLIVQSGSNAWKIVSFSIYGCSLIFLFVCSTLHHAISSTEEVSCTHTLFIDSSVFAFSNYGHWVVLCSHNYYICNHVWCNDEQNL